MFEIIDKVVLHVRMHARISHAVNWKNEAPEDSRFFSLLRQSVATPGGSVLRS